MSQKTEVFANMGITPLRKRECRICFWTSLNQDIKTLKKKKNYKFDTDRKLFFYSVQLPTGITDALPAHAMEAACEKHPSTSLTK